MKRSILVAALFALAACDQTAHVPAPSTPYRPPLPATPAGAPPAQGCGGPEWAAAAAVNASSLTALPWEPYRRPEFGWETYAPVIAKEIGAACPPDSPGFAAALADWQQQRGMPADGLVSSLTFTEVKGLWQERRPFVMATLKGGCPGAPDARTLVAARPEEGSGGKPILLRPGALEAYRRMVEAARRDVPGLAGHPDLLTIFSGFRDPAEDDARCVAEGNCQGVVRARCSAHRSGLAMDLYLEPAPGFKVDDANDDNRRAMSRTAAYRWLVANADRFGFAHYVFEPWHWEWAGEPLQPSAPLAPLPPPAAAPDAPGNGSPPQGAYSTGPTTVDKTDDPARADRRTSPPGPGGLQPGGAVRAP